MTIADAQKKTKGNHGWQHLLLIVIVIIGGYFRFIGLNWDENFHLHPDERFLSMVESSLSPVKSLADYFNTDASSLNPHNTGHTFFVYGTFPIVIVRYLASATGQVGYDQVTILGRICSALIDVGTICLVYLISWQLFKKIKISLLSAAFYAFAVLPIQLSHYFTVDTFSTFFGMLTFYIGSIILTHDRSESRKSADKSIYSSAGLSETGRQREEWNFDWKYFIFYPLFGIALGMAAASKINAAALAILLPIASLLSPLMTDNGKRKQNFWTTIMPGWIVAALAFLLTFRVLQPYAFAGTSFFSVKLNPKWVQNLKELQNLSASTTGFPPSVQWAERPIWFAWENMVNWGLGIPLGLLAWFGLAILAVFKKGKESAKFWYLALWTIFYFLWQEIQYTRSMRYQMLVYPTLVIIAAFFIDILWEKGNDFIAKSQKKIGEALTVASHVLGIGTLMATLLWAFAFTRIYSRPVTRIQASYWIYQNVPGPINLQIEIVTRWSNSLSRTPWESRSATRTLSD